MDTALQQAPEEVQTRFTQTIHSTQQEQHENAAEPAAPAEHDPRTEPALGADSRTPLSGNDEPDSLLTQLARNPGIISETPCSGDDGIAEQSEEQPEGSQRHPDDVATQSPSLTQFDPAGDVATLFAANLALSITAARSINSGKGYNELLTSVRRLVDRLNRRGLMQLFGVTATTALISSWLNGLDPGEQERVVAAIVKPERVDAQVIAHIESVLFDAHLSNDKLGPRAALYTVLAPARDIAGYGC